MNRSIAFCNSSALKSVQPACSDCDSQASNRSDVLPLCHSFSQRQVSLVKYGRGHQLENAFYAELPFFLFFFFFEILFLVIVKSTCIWTHYQFTYIVHFLIGCVGFLDNVDIVAKHKTNHGMVPNP